MSTESAFAERLACFYGRENVAKTRDERINFLQEQINLIDKKHKRDDEQHKLECDSCRNGEPFCLHRFKVKYDWDKRNFLTRGIYAENDDEKYAQKARYTSVDYQDHIDGFCSYWQNIKYRRFVFANWRCEQCNAMEPLNCHHLHYDTLGFEELNDVRALCRQCHKAEHGR